MLISEAILPLFVAFVCVFSVVVHELLPWALCRRPRGYTTLVRVVLKAGCMRRPNKFQRREERECDNLYKGCRSLI